MDLSNREYIGIELDSSLVSHLNTNFPSLEILNKDFLSISAQDLKTQAREILLFGNIPYYLSTKILLKFLEIEFFKEAYFTVQKEFFEILVAPVKSKRYSSLSVLFQTFCELKKLFEIGRLNFFPKPKVESLFFSLKKKKMEFKDLQEYSLFLKACFARPRKILLNNPYFEDLEDSILTKLFKLKILEKNMRIQELSPEKIYELFQVIKNLKFSLSF